ATCPRFRISSTTRSTVTAGIANPAVRESALGGIPTGLPAGLNDAPASASGMDDGAASRPGVEGEIEAQVMVEPPTAPGPPFAAARADDAEGGVGAGVLGPPDGEGERGG